MAWTAPRTWVTAEVVTAALMNTHLRDNLLETSAATATTAGDLVYADAANSMGSRLGIGASGSLLTSDGSIPVWGTVKTDNRTDSTTGTNTGFLSLGGAAWYNDAGQVEVELVTGTAALVMWGANIAVNTAGAVILVGLDLTGATTVVPSDVRSLVYESSVANDKIRASVHHLFTGLTAGTNKFQLHARVTSGTGTLGSPEIAVIPL